MSGKSNNPKQQNTFLDDSKYDLPTTTTTGATKKNMKSPLQSTPQKQNYGGTSREMSENEEIRSPLLAQHDDEMAHINLFQNTPLFQDHSNLSFSKSPPPYHQQQQQQHRHLAPQYEYEEQEREAQLANTFLDMVPTAINVSDNTGMEQHTPATVGTRITMTSNGSQSTLVASPTHISPSQGRSGVGVPPPAQRADSIRSTTTNPTTGEPSLRTTPRSNWAAITRMLARMAPEKGKIIIGVSAMMIGSLCMLLIPLAIGKLVDLVGKPETQFKDIRWILYAAMIAIVVNAVANFVQLSLLLVAGDKVVAVLRIELFKALIYRNISFFDTARVGELLSRLSTDVNALNQALTVDIAELGQRIAVVAGSLLYMLYISWDLSCIVFVIAPLIGITASRLARLFHVWAAKVNDALAQASIVAEETLSNIRTVRSLGMEYMQQLRYNEKIITSYRLNRKQKLMKSGQRTFVYFAAGCAVVGVLWYGSWKVIQKQLTAGDLLTFIIMGLNVGENSGKMLDNYTNISTAASACSISLDLVEEGKKNTQLYIDYKNLTPWHKVTNDVDFDQVLKNMGKLQSKGDNVMNPTGSRLAEAVTAGTTLILDAEALPILPRINFNVPITFQKTSFTYPSRPNQPVLRGIDMTIAPSSQVAFVGASGSGKSSAMALLLQMYDVNGGKITIGNTNIRDINPVLWRSSIAYVEQMPTLFNTTILDNVLTGVCNFKLHDCAYTIQQIRLERENERKFFSSLTNTSSGGGGSTTGPEEMSDIEAGPQSRRNNTIYSSNSRQNQSGRRSSVEEREDEEEEEEIICPCRSNPDLPLCQDLFGRQYTMRDVINACELAHAHEFITEFPDGYYTLVSGLAVSGGQCQRISIARAFLRQAELILLDEVSSALDPVNEDAIVSAINKLVVGKTVITIAHRLSTIKHIGTTNPNDRIFVFKAGNIAEQGTHADLISRPNGEFKKLSELQQLVAQAELH